jgi:hypothetical protein
MLGRLSRPVEAAIVIRGARSRKLQISILYIVLLFTVFQESKLVGLR